jgi:hypothetical protein
MKLPDDLRVIQLLQNRDFANSCARNTLIIASVELHLLKCNKLTGGANTSLVYGSIRAFAELLNLLVLVHVLIAIKLEANHVRSEEAASNMGKKLDSMRGTGAREIRPNREPSARQRWLRSHNELTENATNLQICRQRPLLGFERGVQDIWRTSNMVSGLATTFIPRVGCSMSESPLLWTLYLVLA